MHPSTPCASEPAAAQSTGAFADWKPVLTWHTGLNSGLSAAEPVAAEPVAAEPVAAEPATVTATSWLRRAWHRLSVATPATPVTVLRYHGCAAGWRVVGIRANRAQAERLLSLAQRVNPAATLKLR